MTITPVRLATPGEAIANTLPRLALQLQQLGADVLSAAATSGLLSSAELTPSPDTLSDFKLSTDPKTQISQLLSPNFRERERHAATLLQPLREYEQTRTSSQPDLRLTLEPWLDNVSATRIANKLCYHRHTIAYHLEKLDDLFGDDMLHVPLQRLALRLALFIDDERINEGRELGPDIAELRRLEFMHTVLSAVGKIVHSPQPPLPSSPSDRRIKEESDNPVVRIIESSPAERQDLATAVLQPVKAWSTHWQQRNAAPDTIDVVTRWLDVRHEIGGHSSLARELGVHRHTLDYTIGEVAAKLEGPNMIWNPRFRWAVRLLLHIDGQADQSPAA